MGYEGWCPLCKSKDITPGKKMWHCNACGADFPEAMFPYEKQPDVPAEGAKKDGNTK